MSDWVKAALHKLRNRQGVFELRLGRLERKVGLVAPPEDESEEESVQDYDWKISAKKAASELGLVILAAVAVALGNALVDPASVGFALPADKLWLVPVLSAAGRGLLNWAKNRNKR